MSTLPSWTDADWADTVAEPFRSDREFWTSLAASADAVLSLAAAAAVAVVMVLNGAGAWSVLPFLAPGVLVIRAGVKARLSNRRSRPAFDDRAAWRDAERAAVASVFLRVLGRRRGRAG
jgi:hypothetical protein